METLEITSTPVEVETLHCIKEKAGTHFWTFVPRTVIKGIKLLLRASVNFINMITESPTQLARVHKPLHTTRNILKIMPDTRS